MKIRHLSLLIKCATRAHYKAGETLFAEGAVAFRLFLIKSGSVSLQGHSGESGQVIRKMAIAGDVLSQSWLDAPAFWPLTARAMEDTEVIVLSGARLMTSAEEFPEFGAELAKRAPASVISAFLPPAERAQIDDHPAAWPAFEFDGRTQTVSGGRFAFASEDTVNISLASAKKFFLHDGERVQVVTPQGTADLPVHINTEAAPQPAGSRTLPWRIGAAARD